MTKPQQPAVDKGQGTKRLEQNAALEEVEDDSEVSAKTTAIAEVGPGLLSSRIKEWLTKNKHKNDKKKCKRLPRKRKVRRYSKL